MRNILALRARFFGHFPFFARFASSRKLAKPLFRPHFRPRSNLKKRRVFDTRVSFWGHRRRLSQQGDTQLIRIKRDRWVSPWRKTHANHCELQFQRRAMRNIHAFFKLARELLIRLPIDGAGQIRPPHIAGRGTKP